LFCGIYVDDEILMGNNFQEIKKIIKQFKTEFKMTIIYKPKIFFFGLEINREEDNIKLKQEEYTKKTLKQFGMEKSKSVKILILKNEERNIQKKEDFKYREIIGSLLYLSTKTKPDISFEVGFCSRFL